MFCFKVREKNKRTFSVSVSQGQSEGQMRSLSFCLFLPVSECFYGDKQSGWDRWKCCHGNRRGEHACLCMHVNEYVSVQVTLLDQGLCCACGLLKLAVLFWPLSFNRLWQTNREAERMDDGQINVQSTKQYEPGVHLILLSHLQKPVHDWPVIQKSIYILKVISQTALKLIY